MPAPLRPLADDPSTIPATSWATRRPRPSRPRRSAAGTPTQPTADRAPTLAGARPWSTPRLINDDLRAVAELFAFVAANPVEARRMLGPSPGRQVTDTHAAGWFRQVSRIPHQPALNDRHYVDDHALAQIPAALPLLGLPASSRC